MHTPGPRPRDSGRGKAPAVARTSAHTRHAHRTPTAPRVHRLRVPQPSAPTALRTFPNACPDARPLRARKAVPSPLSRLLLTHPPRQLRRLRPPRPPLPNTNCGPPPPSGRPARPQQRLCAQTAAAHNPRLRGRRGPAARSPAGRFEASR